MNAPLELGTLDGTYLTCPMHCAQFDVTSGEAISGPVTADLGHRRCRRGWRIHAEHWHVDEDVRTESMRTYRTRLEAGWSRLLSVWALQGGLPKRAASARSCRSLISHATHQIRSWSGSRRWSASVGVALSCRTVRDDDCLRARTVNEAIRFN